MIIWCACAVSAAESGNGSALKTILDARRDYGEYRTREKRREQREEREDRRYQRHHDKDKHHDNRRDGRDSKQHRR
ncbi:MAG: hypothetical protein IKT79_02310 [Akkermansia sp.]|nr:hypothetical protein [Akkermansia sp.]